MSIVNDIDIKFMRRCIELAHKGAGMVQSNPMVGAVLVRDGEIIAEGYHQKFGEAHAEVECLNHDSLDEKDFHDGILYVSLEPCCVDGKTGACTSMILERGVKRVIVGMVDPDERMSGKGIELLRSAGLEVSVLEQEVKSEGRGSEEVKKLIGDLKFLNRFFVKHRISGLPWVTVKMAMSSDGYVAPDPSVTPPKSLSDISPYQGRDSWFRIQPFWITGEESRDHVHVTRGKYGAILVGLGTVIADDPGLTTYGKSEWQPWRIALDGDSRMPKDCRLLTDQFAERTFVVSSIDEVFEKLKSLDVNSLYVEGGPTVWKSFFDVGLVDEVQIYQSPDELGGGIDSGLDMQMLADEFVLKDKQSFGNDVWRQFVYHG